MFSNYISFDEIFEQFEKSGFLTRPKKTWKTTFDWIFKDDNWLHIHDGEYVDYTPKEKKK